MRIQSAKTHLDYLNGTVKAEAEWLSSLTHLNLSSNEAEEQRLQNDPEVGQVGRHGVVLSPALPSPAKASRKGHHQNGLERSLHNENGDS